MFGGWDWEKWKAAQDEMKESLERKALELPAGPLDEQDLLYGELSEKDLEGLSMRERGDFNWFKSMGFRPVDALLLATAGAPPARVERALFEGCSLEHALEIWL